MISHFSKLAFLALTALFGSQLYGKDTLINQQFVLSNGSTYKLYLNMTDEGRANVIPYGFKIGVLGSIELSKDDLALESNAKFKRVYDLAQEASSKLKQSAKLPAPLALTTVEAYRHDDAVGVVTPIEDSSVKLTRIEKALADFNRALQAGNKAVAYAQFTTLAPLFDAPEDADDRGFLNLKKEFQASKDRFLLDGVIRRDAYPLPLFKSDRKTWNGRVLRHLANLCFIDPSCQDKEFLVTLIFFDEFAPNALKNFYKDLNGSKARVLSVDSYVRAVNVAGEPVAMKFFESLATADDQERADLIANYSSQIVLRVAEADRPAFKQKFQTLLEAIFQWGKKS